MALESSFNVSHALEKIIKVAQQRYVVRGIQRSGRDKGIMFEQMPLGH